jgi:hypothetical protein
VFPEPRELPFALMTKIDNYQILMTLSESPQTGEYSARLRQYCLNILISMLQGDQTGVFMCSQLNEGVFHFFRNKIDCEQMVEVLNAVIADDPEIAKQFFEQGFANDLLSILRESMLQKEIGQLPQLISSSMRCFSCTEELAEQSSPVITEFLHLILSNREMCLD